MLRTNPASLWSSIVANPQPSSRLIVGAGGNATWVDLAAGTVFDCRADALRGCGIVLATADQLAAAAALIQLDGLARRIVLYPPDLPREHLGYVAKTAEADLVLTDDDAFVLDDIRVECLARCAPKSAADEVDRSAGVETEWILLTSGTTGLPKLVVHTLATLAGAIDRGTASSAVWSTFYDIRRYGGLQIFLRAVLGGTTLVLKSAKESIGEFLTRAGDVGITHILGTPSHWRSMLMSDAAGRIAPQYVRLSGEISDQAILNQLRALYPNAKLVHAFASTEAGVVFEVKDGLMGFSAETIGNIPNVETKVENGTLRARSSRNAFRYLGADSPELKDADGFVDTGDAIEDRDGRCFFVGRRDGTINIGGLKVHPEEVEAVINRHPDVSVSLVRMKKNPIMGGLVIADVVLKKQPQAADDAARALQKEILQFCRGELAQHKVPAAINFVAALTVSESGKLIRHA
jgi:acyl-coenzyme A synthetase/AMP-(fatty) acid ligase